MGSQMYFRNPYTSWRRILVLLGLAWCASMGLFLTGKISYPWGWLVLLVLMGWSWYQMRSGRRYLLTDQDDDEPLRDQDDDEPPTPE